MYSRRYSHQAMGWTILVLFPGRGKNFSFSAKWQQELSRRNQSSVPRVSGLLSRA